MFLSFLAQRPVIMIWVSAGSDTITYYGFPFKNKAHEAKPLQEAQTITPVQLRMNPTHCQR